MIVRVMAIWNLVLTQQIYSEEKNAVHAHNRGCVPLTWGDSTGLQTASYWFSFIYLPLIRSPHFRKNCQLMKFQLEGFFLLLTVFSNRESSPSDFTLLGTFVSQPINKEVGTRE